VVGQCFGLKLVDGVIALPSALWHFNHWSNRAEEYSVFACVWTFVGSRHFFASHCRYGV